MPTPTHKSVHTQDHMFIELDTGERELYDLSTDPYQLQSKPRAGNEQLYSALQTRLNALRACSGAGCRATEWDMAPSITTTVPGADATGVDPATDVTATFSEKMKPTTLTTSTFKLFKVNTDGSTARVTNVTVTPSTDGLKATLNPFGTSTTLLSNNTKYKAVVTTGATDVAGNRLDQNPTITGLQQMEWHFTVSP